MYFTDRGIEELEDRRGDDEVTMAWLAERLRDFVDLNPDFEVPVDRLASWLARLDSEEDLLFRTGRGCAPPGPATAPGAGVPGTGRPAAPGLPHLSAHAICLDLGMMRYIVRCSDRARGKEGRDGTVDR